MSAKKVDIASLEQKAIQYRRDILETVNAAGSGHPGGSLSAVEILISLYEYKMSHKPDDPAWEDRDRLIISKGHITPGVYVTLANQGYFPKEDLKGFRKYKSRLQGHVHTKVPGVEFNTGSLGHGLSVTNGMAMGAKLLKKSFKIYCLLGDGENQEGSVWEAAMSAAHHKLGNVCAIVEPLPSQFVGKGLGIGQQVKCTLGHLDIRTGVLETRGQHLAGRRQNPA